MRVLLTENEERLDGLVKGGPADEGFAVDVLLTTEGGLRAGAEGSPAKPFPCVVLDVPFGRATLITVRGAGYRLEAV
ncbi:hypothetical protein [Nonomuraea sp. NPDC050783]|uniref:hypothetical protein n=1 Tax=Nonomuraea sp. NPDC050783 TaxID=3154634 RepID=UPI003467169A